MAFAPLLDAVERMLHDLGPDAAGKVADRADELAVK
jgi:hypothetical protein